MIKGDFLLIQPINIILDEETFNYGLLDGIYYPYMIARKTGEQTCKDVLFGGEFNLTNCEEKRYDGIKQINEIAFKPARKVIDVDKTLDNMKLVELYVSNQGTIPEQDLEASTSALKVYFNRIDYASGKTQQLPATLFKDVFRMSIGDISRANKNANWELEYRLERAKHR